MEAVCDLTRLGTRGTTDFVPSGDSGFGAKMYGQFYVNFPASCTVCGF